MTFQIHSIIIISMEILHTLKYSQIPMHSSDIHLLFKFAIPLDLRLNSFLLTMIVCYGMTVCYFPC